MKKATKTTKKVKVVKKVAKKAVANKKAVAKKAVAKKAVAKKAVAKKAQPASRLILIDKRSRRVLIEGRNYQMGFAFCKKVGPNTVRTTHPISPCKDYCSDVVWSEHVDRRVSCCGLVYNKQSIFDGHVSYLAFQICDFMYAARDGVPGYAHLEADRQRLRDNYKHMETLLHDIEQDMGITPLTEICRTDDRNKFVAKMSYFWSKYPYLISLYTLLLRIAQFYDGSIPPKAWMKSLNTRFAGLGADSYQWNTAGPRLAHLRRLGATQAPVQHMNATQDGAIFHRQGILGFDGLRNLPVHATRVG